MNSEQTITMSPMQRTAVLAIQTRKPDSLDTQTTYRDGKVSSEDVPVWFLTKLDNQYWYADQSGDCFYTYDPLPTTEEN